MLLPVRVSVPPDRQDPHLVEKLQTELPGIFVWAVEGLRRLRQQGHFTVSTLCQDALDTYRTESNPARAFLRECVVAEPEGSIESAELYKSYRNWCEDHGYKPLNAAHFGHEVRREFPGVVRKKVPSLDPSKRVWAYLGIGLRPGEPSPDGTPRIGVPAPVAPVAPVILYSGRNGGE